MIRRSQCLLCSRDLEPLDNDTQKHPDVEDCEVRYTDGFGIAIEIDDGTLYGNENLEQPIIYKTFPFVDEVMRDIFASHQLPVLGGQSSGRGWSSVSKYQRCPYLWKQSYVEERAWPSRLIESPSLAIGTLVHVFLALHYTSMMDDTNPYRVLTAEAVYDRVRLKANPDFVNEAWRVFKAYLLYYKLEEITPLAVEYDLRDPRTRESCRFDLIAWLDRGLQGGLPGAYIFEHKTGSRFDADFLEAWQNDGEVIGQVALWKKLGLDKRFGPLRGTVMNLLGKQKLPRFHRTYIAPDSWRVENHLSDLRRWEGIIQLSLALDNFPRSRGNCISRYGRCDYYDHCATNEEL